MNALVIGGAGYIGSHAVRELVRAGHSVVVLDDLSTGNAHAVHPSAKLIIGDILDKEGIVSIFESAADSGEPIDVVFHFAAKMIVSESVAKPLDYYRNNVVGMLSMLEAMVECGVRNLVFSSTAAVYGRPEGGICHEDAPCRPINPYGETKLACERMVEWVAQAHGLNYCILRYFNVAGADSSLEIGLEKDLLTWIVPLIMQAALGNEEKLTIFGDDYDTPDGTCIRDYVHVTDLAKAHILGAQHLLDGKGSLVANLGSGSGFSVAEVVEAAKRIVDFKSEYGPRRPGDPDILIADIARARELLGWEPEIGLDEMLRSDYEFRKLLTQRRK